ncbi:[citrate (pro-3S)-lyase] ligase [Prodigiosinella confusarubida]|uniref:[Citrate [pro-3S]-lyase] ligase n=1 Tax=Serratia sp. (strain ATCC 39006) TaxID=104623 RepID=A0A2I5TJC5_SERS3|nr:[citrate (pro-3S)-lyase] ligase [Serratia sp. ATCC 39006]AUH00336.1 [citrate (pro-3S)-lyase] ligase [Serratia sp. ATCC 39006]AUH04656.1 [citrate (pro-3S)-lyase] ligase [Serratia sp. ATCC 39006]
MTELTLTFSVTDLQRHPQRVEPVRQLLADSGLDMDCDIHWMVEARRGGELVGCAGLVDNVIKCVAVSKSLRGENLSARLLSEVQNLALSHGHFHLFLCTRPCNRERFQHSGFCPVAQSGENAILMENTPRGIQRYCQRLAAFRQPGTHIGAIVMNANPFTKGHRYLVEQAARSCDWLHIFVVREDASFIPFADRLAMVQSGVSGLSNVTVHPGSDYVISRATFPAYFLKDTGKVQRAWSEIDVLIFRDNIAPALGITHRFIGSEPFCKITRQYNQTLHSLLRGHITMVELPRIEADGQAISASEVRRLLKTEQFARLRDIVPETTFTHLVARYAAAKIVVA